MGKIVFHYKKGDVIYYLLAVIIIFFGAIAPLVPIILPTGTAQIAVASLAFVPYFFILLGKKRVLRKQVTEVVIIHALLLIMMSMVFWNTAWDLSHIVIYLIACLFCIIAFYCKDFVKLTCLILKGFLAADIVFALFTVLCFFSSSFYFNYVINLFPERHDYLVYLYNTGCMAGLTSHYSTNGMILSTGLVASATYFLCEKSKRRLMLCALFVVALLMTGKRAHIIFSIAAIFIMYYFSLSKDKKLNRWIKTIGIVVAVLCVLTILLTLVPQLATFVERFKMLSREGNVSAERFDLWAIAIDAFKEHPLFGIGWEQYKATLTGGFSSTRDTHNVYLQLLCETGIIGSIFYFTWFAWMYVKTVKLVSFVYKKIADYQIRLLVTFSIGFQSFFLMYCMTGNPLYETFMFIPYYVCCAVTLCMYFNLHGLNATVPNTELHSLLSKEGCNI